MKLMFFGELGFELWSFGACPEGPCPPCLSASRVTTLFRLERGLYGSMGSGFRSFAFGPLGLGL